jgi:hypothetical protein
LTGEGGRKEEFRRCSSKRRRGIAIQTIYPLTNISLLYSNIYSVPSSLTSFTLSSSDLRKKMTDFSLSRSPSLALHYFSTTLTRDMIPYEREGQKRKKMQYSSSSTNAW